MAVERPGETLHMANRRLSKAKKAVTSLYSMNVGVRKVVVITHDKRPRYDSGGGERG